VKKSEQAASTGKQPSYPWYPRDFLADVLDLEDQEELLYRRLLDRQWLKGEVPRDFARMAKAARMSVGAVTASWPAIAEHFPLVGPDGGWQNRRLERIREEQAAYRDRRSKAGQKGNESRWKEEATPDGSGIANGSQCDRIAIANGSPASASASASAFTPTSQRVREVLPPEFHEPLDRLLRSSGNPEGVVDELARLLAVHPTVIPTGAGMRGESPLVVGTCLRELVNGNRPEWNVAYFKGMIRRVKQREPETPSGKAETPGEKVLRLASQQEAA